MEDISKMMEEYGIESDVPKIKNTGIAFHVFENGDYTALVGKLNIAYLNSEKKKVKKGEPGAVAAYGMFDLLIAKDPQGVNVISKDYKINQEVDYGIHIYKEYISLDSDKQFRNKAVFESFTIEGTPIAVVIEDGKEYEIALGNVAAFYGMPCSFKIVESKGKDGKIYKNMAGLKLSINTLSKELLKKRTDAMTGLYDAINEKRPKKEDATNAPEDVGSAEDDLLDDGLADEFEA